MNIPSSRLVKSLSAVAVLLLGVSVSAWGQDDKPEKPTATVPKVEKAEGKIPGVFSKPAPEGIDDLKAMQKHIKKVLEKVVPATVGLVVGSGSGSGVIISEDGYILTAGHVSGKPDQKCNVIMPDGKILKGKTLGYNKTIDSGLVKITTPGKYPFVGIGESGKLQTGQWCLTLGHPGGFKKGRSPVLRLGRILASNKNLIRSDCALVGGDSGGPLFDLAGRVIGIHSRISAGITENIHVPVDTYPETWDRLTASEEWGGMFDFGGRRRSQAVLGVSFSGDNTDLKIIDFTKGSPAEEAGVQVGDVITAIDGKKLKVRSELQDYLAQKKPGDVVKLTVDREGEKETFALKLVKRANP